MSDDRAAEIRAGQAERLRMSREAAGYQSKIDAVRAFAWTEQTYYSHESGKRGLKRTAAERYGRAFRVSATWLLTGEGTPHEGVRGAPIKFDRDLVGTAIEGLLEAVLPEMDNQERAAFREAVLALLELHQRRNRNDKDMGTIRTLIAGAASATLPISRE